MDDRSLYQGAYEKERMKRYKHVSSRLQYTKEEIDTSYRLWLLAGPSGRLDRWNHYCDLRDGVPIGTNHEIMIAKDMREERRLS